MRYVLEAATAACAERDVMIALETHGRYTSTPEKFDATLALVKTARLAINFDTGNAFLNGNDPYEWLEAVIDRDVHVHAKDISHENARLYRGKVYGMLGCACGDGVLDWRRILEICERAPHDLVLSVECDTIDDAAAQPRIPQHTSRARCEGAAASAACASFRSTMSRTRPRPVRTSCCWPTGSAESAAPTCTSTRTARSWSRRSPRSHRRQLAPDPRARVQRRGPRRRAPRSGRPLSGDRVSVMPLFFCGHCSACREGRQQCCAQLGAVGYNWRWGGMGEYADRRRSSGRSPPRRDDRCAGSAGRADRRRGPRREQRSGAGRRHRPGHRRRPDRAARRLCRHWPPAPGPSTCLSPTRGAGGEPQTLGLTGASSTPPTAMSSAGCRDQFPGGLDVAIECAGNQQRARSVHRRRTTGSHGCPDGAAPDGRCSSIPRALTFRDVSLKGSTAFRSRVGPG